MVMVKRARPEFWTVDPFAQKASIIPLDQRAT